MARDSKDLARRLRFYRYPVPDSFRRYYWVVGVALVIVAAAAWYLLTLRIGRRQYLPGPVSRSHATFGDRCERCHDQFHAVSNDACLTCHSRRDHFPEKEVAAPACAHCHVEHRQRPVFLAVSNTACVECHGALHIREGQNLQVQVNIRSFAAHPVFAALRDGRRDRDPARIRFNHKLHLALPHTPPEEQLRCASCHRLQRDGRLMQPIAFETHCRRCHKMTIQGPAESFDALHAEPQAVVEDVRRHLLDVAASLVVAASDELRVKLRGAAIPRPELLSPKPVPGRERVAFDNSRLQLDVLQAELFQPLRLPAPSPPGSPQPSAAPPHTNEGAEAGAVKVPSLYDLNRYCFLCHDESGSRGPDNLPSIAATNIAHRWLPRGEFSHQRHAMLKCEVCHAHVAESSATADTNLPDNSVCKRCHVDSRQSAGTNCMLCHLYHGTTKARVHPPETPGMALPTPSRQVGLTCLTGGECPP